MSFWRIEQHDPRQLAVIDDSGLRWRYAELLTEVTQMEGRLKSGLLIFILCRNTTATLIGYLACLRCGAVPLLLDADLDSTHLAELITTYRPAFLWAPTGQVQGESHYQTLDYQLTATGKAPQQLHPQLALLVTTSGSTGSPKLVRLSQQNLQSNATSISEYLALDETEKPLVHLPLNYVFGLSVVNSHLLVGATLILTRYGLMQREFWQQMASENVTSLSGVPYTFEMLHRLRFSRMSFPALRTLTQAGGKLSTAMHQFFADYAQQHSKKFVVMYGAAEATARMAWLPAELAQSKCGSIGLAIPGGKLTLHREDGSLITIMGEQGELYYHGDNVMMGYASDGDDLHRGDDLNGLLITGDIATQHADGCFYIVGRKKRFLKIFGNRVGLDEMEQLLKTHFIGLDCACVGRDDQLTVFITQPDLADEVKRFASQVTKLHTSAFKINVVDTLVKTSSGKTHYERLMADETGI
ncbi:AMP-binding protein [Pantoea ananatis]|uniref:AMP-binding protein n=1 Tax=Pantoea ananas TaxID=553 RepID=UPI0024AD713F|nr:AMP-binding protein [Pantoea ananatis]MDI6538468.1 AMP-binding protein [Pantoea ananatis]